MPHRLPALAMVLLLASPLRAAPGAPDPSRPAPQDRFPNAAAAYVVAVNGRVVWARAADAPRPPASLTKLMTALLALERDWDPAAWITVSPRAARASGTRIGLRPGEQLTAGDALLAVLVSSSNDACLALAEHAAGGVEAFVARMNRRAAELGLTASHFRNPCGNDAPRHVASARDLLRLAQAALALPALRRAVALDRAQLVTRGGRAISLATTNVLLGRFEGARGVKSGYTAGAGRCLVALAERGGVEVLVVMLDARDRWWTAAGLLEAAFEETPRRG